MKITPIIPTGAAPIECLLWSVFSLLLRARPNDIIEHFITVLNGPDKRTGNETICDKKQAFLEDLKQLDWHHTDTPQIKKPMPLTIIRAWSRIGHPEAVEMAIPWVKTDHYLLMHDDIIIIKRNWLKNIKDHPKCVISYAPNLMCCQCDDAKFQNKNLLRFPHLLCCFLICNKNIIKKLGSSWCGYHIKTPIFKLEDKFNVEEFMNYYKSLNLLDNPPKNQYYEYISMEMGAWHFYNAVQQGYEFAALDPNVIIHMGTMSWECETGKTKRIQHCLPYIKALESEIMAHPEYSKLYQKYIEDTNYFKWSKK
jgi:hypothetical protein